MSIEFEFLELVLTLKLNYFFEKILSEEYDEKQIKKLLCTYLSILCQHRGQHDVA